MFAVIQTGGKQYRVEKGSVIRVEKIESDIGDAVVFSDVLMIGLEHNPKIGSPTVPGAKVVAEVVDQVRDRKVIIFKKKRRHNYRRKKGHRQHRTLLKITEISVA